MAVSYVNKLNKKDQDRVTAYSKALQQSKVADRSKNFMESNKYNLTSDYKNDQWAKGFGDTAQQQVGNAGNSVGYSQQLGDSRNATAYIPGVGYQRVSIVNGKTQDTGLPAGTVITPDGSNQRWQIKGATADGYTSSAYTGTLPKEQKLSSGGGYYNNYSNFGYSGNNPYQEVYDQQQQMLLEAQRQAEEVQRLAVEKGVNTLNAQKTGINQQTDEALRQAYINDQLGNRNLAQYMKAQGMTGGLSESSMIDKRAAYENVLNNTRQSGMNMLNQVDTDISNLRTTGDLNIANNASEYGLRLVDLLGSNLEKQIAQMNADRAFNYNAYRDGVSDDRYNQQWNYNVGQDQLSNDRYNTEWQYQLDRDKINDSRYDQEWQNQLRQQAYSNALKQANSIKEPKPKTYNKVQYDNALNAYKNGDRSQPVIDIIESYGGLPVDTVIPKSNYKFTPDGNVTEANPFNNETVNRLLRLDTSLPFPNPRSEEEVRQNVMNMKQKGMSDQDIIAYGKRYGVEIIK